MKVLIFLVVILQCVGVYFNWLEDGVIQFSADFAVTEAILFILAGFIWWITRIEKG